MNVFVLFRLNYKTQKLLKNFTFKVFLFTVTCYSITDYSQQAVEISSKIQKRGDLNCKTGDVLHIDEAKQGNSLAYKKFCKILEGDSSSPIEGKPKNTLHKILRFFAYCKPQLRQSSLIDQLPSQCSRLTRVYDKPQITET